MHIGRCLFEHTQTGGPGPPIRLRFHEVTIVAGEPTLLHHDALRFATRAELDALDLLPGDRALAARIEAV